MKKIKSKSRRDIIVDGCGAGAREIYLEMNPHGFSKVNKVHASKKVYNRKQNKAHEV
jgi:hypothetical protein